LLPGRLTRYSDRYRRKRLTPDKWGLRVLSVGRGRHMSAGLFFRYYIRISLLINVASPCLVFTGDALAEQLTLMQWRDLSSPHLVPPHLNPLPVRGEEISTKLRVPVVIWILTFGFWPGRLPRFPFAMLRALAHRNDSGGLYLRLAQPRSFWIFEF